MIDTKTYLFSAASILLGTLLYFVSIFIIKNNQITISFSLVSIYVYEIVASLIVILTFALLCKKIPDQLGYLFLTFIFLKIGFFLLIFQDMLGINLSKIEKSIVIIPHLLFLFLETFYVAKVLNSLTFSK